MDGFRVGVAIAGVLFLLLSLRLLVPGIIGHEWNSVGRLKALLPQLREDFAAIQPRLDTLRNGGFAQHFANAGNPYERASETHEWVIHYDISQPEERENMVTVFYEDWHTLEWLSQDEKDAILFLGHYFDSIAADRTQDIFAYDNLNLRDATLMIFYSQDYRGFGYSRVIHNEDMGSGYTLTIERWMLGPALVRIHIGGGIILLTIAIVLLYFGIFCRRRKA
jgi:hypothetical protein